MNTLPSRKSQRVRTSRKDNVRLDIETLDSRMMMSATPPSELAAAPTTMIVLAVAEDFAVPASIAEGDRIIAAAPGGGGTAMPNPEDDDGGWGPIGPWVREGLTDLAEKFAERMVHEMPVMVMQGGTAGQPSPDDDSPWPPGIGPLVKTADDLYVVVARDVLQDLTQDANPDPTPWQPEFLSRAILRRLTESAEPDPEPWIDWTAIAESTMGIGPSDVGYPAPDDDGDWGPAGPVVHEGLRSIADAFAERLGEQMKTMAMRGGSAGQPSPDDDGPWPPGVGPLIRTADDLFILVAVDAIRNPGGRVNADSASSLVSEIQMNIQSQLQLFRDAERMLQESHRLTDGDGADRIDTLTRRGIGDANNDGVFNSSDLVQVLAAGRYEDGIPENATFEQGDWNNDGDFDSEDLVLALAYGAYEVEPADVDETAEIDPTELQRVR